jgi:drug/metabolite transporter (DMT)-like permease
MLVSTTPLWVALFSPFFLKEPVTRLVVIGMALALVGAVIIGLSDSCAWDGSRLTCPAFSEFVQGGAFVGDLLALMGAIMGAGYVMIGRKLRSGISLIGYIFIVYGIAAIGLIILMLAAGESPVGYPPQAYLWFLLLAIFPQLLGHSSFNYALGYLSAAFVSIMLLGEPICATILAYFLLDEIPTPEKIFGAILILAGIYLASRAEGQKTG